MKLLHLALFTLLLFTTATTYATSFRSYHNSRFNYEVHYPSFLIPQGESENGDGQKLQGNKAELIVYGSYLPESLDEAYASAKAQLKDFSIKYDVKKPNFFVISGENANQIAYFKTIQVCGENINMQLFYPRSERKEWESLVNKISQSFKYSSASCKKS